MSMIQVILRKEFLQIFRNKSMLPILFLMPIIQLLVLSFAATYELKEVDFALVDRDQSDLSRELVSKLQASGYFSLELETFDTDVAIQAMDEGNVSLIIQIPADFETRLATKEATDLQLIIDAVDGSTAGLIQSYSSAIINDLNKERLVEQAITIRAGEERNLASINVIPQNWYNPELDYITFMVPGILVVLVSMIGLFLSGTDSIKRGAMSPPQQVQ